jgi:hypothetical protein
MAIRSLMGATGNNLTFPIVYLIALGADAFDLGVYAGLMSATVFAQFAGLSLVARFPKARVSAAGEAFRGLLLIVAAGVAWIDGPRLAIIAAIAVFFAGDVARAIMRTAWMPLQKDNVADDETGWFFSRARTAMHLGAMTSTLIAGWYIGNSRDPAVFVPLLVIGGILQAARSVITWHLPERWKRVDSSPAQVLMRLRQAASEPDFRTTFMATALLTGVVGSLIPPVFNSLLAELGYNLGDLVMIRVASLAGAVLTMMFWGNVLDRFGPRILLAPATLALAIVTASRAFIPAYVPEGDNTFGLGMIYGINFLQGVLFQSCLRLVITRLHYRVIRRKWQSESFTLIQYGNAVLGMVLPPSAGYLVGVISETGLHIPGVALPGHGIIMLAAAGLLVLALLTRNRIPGYGEEISAREILRKRFLGDADRHHTDWED